MIFHMLFSSLTTLEMNVITSIIIPTNCFLVFPLSLHTPQVLIPIFLSIAIEKTSLSFLDTYDQHLMPT